MAQNTNSLLSLAEIVRRTGIDRSALNRYLALPENRDLLRGADTHPNYPIHSIPLFLRLAEQHEAGKVTPKTLAAWWEAEEAAAPSMTMRTVDRNSVNGQSAHNGGQSLNNGEALTVTPAAMEHGAERLAEALVNAVQRAGLVVGADRLLSGEEAAALLNCKPRGVAYRVRPVGAATYRLSDIQIYIRSLAPVCPISGRRTSKSEHGKEGVR